MDRLDQLPGGAPEKLTEQRADVVVFACGDPAHGEHDSIAIAACKGLPVPVLERIDLKLTGPMRPEYLRDLSAGTFVIIADTILGEADGIDEVPFIELVGREEPLDASSSTIQPIDEVIAMAQLVRPEPLRGRFLGLIVETVDLNAPPDEVAVERMRAAIEGLIVQL